MFVTVSCSDNKNRGTRPAIINFTGRNEYPRQWISSWISQQAVLSRRFAHDNSRFGMTNYKNKHELTQVVIRLIRWTEMVYKYHKLDAQATSADQFICLHDIFQIICVYLWLFNLAYHNYFPDSKNWQNLTVSKTKITTKINDTEFNHLQMLHIQFLHRINVPQRFRVIYHCTEYSSSHLNLRRVYISRNFKQQVGYCMAYHERTLHSSSLLMSENSVATQCDIHVTPDGKAGRNAVELQLWIIGVFCMVDIGILMSL